MSLANSELSQKSRTSSVYQTNGKPLSPEALYKAKLKYGIYHNPTTQSIGVPSSSGASDTAALLATSTDLSIEPYKRQLAADAQTAALFARKDTAPKKWTKDYIDTDAASAAISAKSLKKQVVATSNSDFANSNAAAASVLSKDSRSLASSNLASLYEFDAVRNGTKNSHASLNIEKLSKASKEHANTMISSRINPERDSSRLGLSSKTDEDDSHLEKFAAVGALASQNYKAPIDPNLEATAIYRNSLVDPKVLAKARLNADHTLIGINKYLGEKDLFLNPDYNKIAIQIAQSHAQKRIASSDKINLGGGLFMTQQELDSIASKIVNPVLEDITSKAKKQREKDAEVAKKKEEQIKLHRQFKLEQQSKKLEEKRLKEEAKVQRRKEMEQEKQKQKDAKLELERSKKEELSKHQDILTAKQKEEERTKKELLAKKQAEEERIQDESTKAEQQRSKELQDAKEERDLKLAPIVEKLRIETDKLAVLNEEKQAIQDITDSQIKNTENANALLLASQDELTNAVQQLDLIKEQIENATTESEKLAKESELKKQEAEVALKKSNEVEAEALLKQAEIDKEKAIVENERLKLELELENAKIEVLEEEKEIAQILPPTKEPTTSAAINTEDPINKSTEPKESSSTSESSSEQQLPKTVVTGTGTVNLSHTSAFQSQDQSTRSIVDASGAITPASKKVKSLVDEVIPKEGTSKTSGNEVKKTVEESADKPSSDLKQVKEEAEKETPAKEKEIGEGNDLKQTFSGFSQGSVDDKATKDQENATESTPDVTEEQEDKHKSFFKEEF